MPRSPADHAEHAEKPTVQTRVAGRKMVAEKCRPQYFSPRVPADPSRPQPFCVKGGPGPCNRPLLGMAMQWSKSKAGTPEVSCYCPQSFCLSVGLAPLLPRPHPIRAIRVIRGSDELRLLGFTEPSAAGGTAGTRGPDRGQGMEGIGSAFARTRISALGFRISDLVLALPSLGFRPSGFGLIIYSTSPRLAFKKG